MTVCERERFGMTFAVFKCLQIVLVLLDGVQCILVVVNIIEYFFLRPLLILHIRCHSMCMYSFTLTHYDIKLHFFFFLGMMKQAIKCIFNVNK